MLETTSFSHNLIQIETTTTTTIHSIQNKLQTLGFEIHHSTSQTEKYFYATIGQNHPHILFIANLPSPTIKITQTQTSEKQANLQTLLCFINACEQFIKERKFNGKISIFIQQKNNFNCSQNLKNIFNQMSLTHENIDFCIIGEPNHNKKNRPEINIGNLGNILFKITTYGDSYSSLTTTSNNNAINNLLSFLYKLKSNLIDNGNEIYSSSTLNILQLHAEAPSQFSTPTKASATIHVKYNNNHTSQDIIRWMQNHINFCNGQFELQYEQISTPYASQISPEINILQETIPQIISSTPHLTTNCTSDFSNFIKDYCPFAELGLSTKNNKQIEENIINLQEIYFQFLHKYLNPHNLS